MKKLVDIFKWPMLVYGFYKGVTSLLIFLLIHGTYWPGVEIAPSGNEESCDLNIDHPELRTHDSNWFKPARIAFYNLIQLEPGDILAQNQDRKRIQTETGDGQISPEKVGKTVLKDLRYSSTTNEPNETAEGSILSLTKIIVSPGWGGDKQSTTNGKISYDTKGVLIRWTALPPTDQKGCWYKPWFNNIP